MRSNLKDRKRHWPIEKISAKSILCVLILVAAYILAVGMYETADVIPYIVYAVLSLLAIYALLSLSCNKSRDVQSNEDADQRNQQVL